MNNACAQWWRKAHLLEDKQISSVGVFDEVFSTWMAFGGNTRDLGSFREETDKITDLHQNLEEVLLTERRDSVAGIKRHRRDPSSDGPRSEHCPTSLIGFLSVHHEVVGINVGYVTAGYSLMRKDMDLEAEIKALVRDKSPYEPRLLKLPEGPSSRMA
ncbi:hypothetical protein Tco_0139388 [Tanacetum coccineum]